MGTWGPAVFSDDLAEDVRADWRAELERGVPSAEATDGLLRKYCDSLTDQDEGPKFWFALAAAQAATGRLQPAVRDRALALIDAGGDVAVFAAESPKLGEQRRVALAKLAATLRGPQRPPTRIVLPKAQPSPIGVGDLVRVLGPNRSRATYFVVIDLADGWPKGSKWPVMVGLLWDDARDPGPAEAATVPLLRSTDGLDRLRTEPAQPMIMALTVSGPTRGPRAWSNFGSVIANGIRRGDAPNLSDRRASHLSGYFTSFVSWETLGYWADGGEDWYARAASLTTAYLDANPNSKKKWPWQGR
jgi:hypothetical protein